jgi:DNA-binding GntR family transcriptional regulator
VTGPDPDPPVARPPSLAEHIRQVLAADIRAGRVKPGEHLAETEIMRRTGVSRTPVREAVQLLQAEGLVVVSPNRGARVARPLTREEALTIYACRLVIEPSMAALAAERVGRAELAQLDALTAEFGRELAGELSVARFSDVDRRFHDLVYAASDSPLLSVFRAYWNRLQVDLTRMVYEREAPRAFHAEHLEILGHLRAADAAATERAMRDHIEHGREVLFEALDPPGA